MLFTVEARDIEHFKEGRTEIEIYVDGDGLEDLLKQLAFLKEPGDHVHFMTEEWGGCALTNTPQVRENTIINHLRITYR